MSTRCGTCGTSYDGGACSRCGRSAVDAAVPVAVAAKLVGYEPPPGSLAPAPAPVSAPVSAPRLLAGRYELLDLLGEGGYGVVHRARQLHTGRMVAVKVLHLDLAGDEQAVARFRREGAVACMLRDAHTVTTYDVDQAADGTLFIAMELLAGRSLYDIIHAEAPVPWRRVLAIVEQIASALAEAHTLGIVHRDLKPENIYVEARPGTPEFVKVLDFGIAKLVGADLGFGQTKLTAMGQTLGTLEFMSPEQLMGQTLDGRSDLYAIGVVMYELLTGELPFPLATGPAQLVAAQLKSSPRPPSHACADAGIPAGVDELVLRCLHKDLARRPRDAATLGESCRTLLATGGEGVRAVGSGVGTAAAASTYAATHAATVPGVQWMRVVLLLAAALAGAVGAYVALRP